MTQTKPKLYQYAVCPFCKKVEAILKLKKIPYEAIEVHPLNKKEIKFSESYRKVPIFIDEEGRQVNDSTPIMKHIDARHKSQRIFDESEWEIKWLKWSDDVLVRALPPLIYNSYPNSLKAFHYITNEGQFSFFQRYLIKYSGAFVMNMVAKKKAKQYNINNPVHHFKICLDEWKQALEEREDAKDRSPNGADLAIFGILRSIEALPAFQYIKENEAVHNWYERLNLAAYNI